MSSPTTDLQLPEGMLSQAVTDEPERCMICGHPLTWVHDHQPDFSGLDDGPYLPGRAPRKKPDPKPAEEVTRIKKQGWETRRKKYGERGHRGSYAR